MRKKISIALNIALVIFGLLGLYRTVVNQKSFAIVFFTQESNYISIIASLLYVLFSKRRVFPRFVRLLKYLSVLNLTLTFLVVLFILGPSLSFNYKWLFFHGSNLYFHLICPLISLISFLFFERYRIYKNDSIIVIEYTVIYALILTILNILGIVEGPYPFLRVTRNPFYMSLFYFVAIIGGCYILSNVLCKIKERIIVK